MTAALNVISYEGTCPALAANPVAALPGHAVVGRVTLGVNAWLGAGSVIRADGHYVRIGDALHMGRAATIHIAHAVYPTLVGDRVCIGADAVVHACTVGDDVVVEKGAVILDGATVGAGSVIEAGSIVYPRSKLEPGTLYAGRPAVLVRALNAHERLARAELQRASNVAADATWTCQPHATQAAPNAFVAGTCDLAGGVQLADGASVWFGSRLDGRVATISIGRLCNVQDNSLLRAGPQGMALGDETTIGHNVQLLECNVGARCLVGIGSRIARDTTIDDDTFVAGGCITEPGQHLSGGLVWGGDPARPIGQMNEAKRAAILNIATVYAAYADALRAGVPG
ncbi:MAG: gamma carbonic anhydrase family protein [Burkholderiaceae bacterium]|nr:gamma carbonic anhydrase family protein [Burkholderiaceae bacterium]